jgi:CheY-like chemotaxis protein
VLAISQLGEPQLLWRSTLTSSWGGTTERQSLLIVDDDLGLLTMLKALFQFDYLVTTATSGAEALEQLSQGVPDAIVLDLEMPGMNGRTLFRQLRERGVLAPILVLSAFGAEAAYAELGAEAFMNKPFEPERLLAAISQLIA